jgi:hypothetical protein
MIVVPYGEGKFDPGLKFVIKTIKDAITGKEDDFLLLNFGFRGTGKSTITLHIEDEYLGEEADVKYIGLNPADFANALKFATDKPLPRFCSNDEANVNKRNSQRTYNKDLLDLYYSIRGKQIFHVWNNPSMDVIDKPFIEDIIKGAIFCVSKETKRPRLYYYFRKEDLLRIWEKYEHLSVRLMKRVKEEYAYYRGWFKDYDGNLLGPYKAKKEGRMDEKVNSFHEKYGESNTEYLKPIKLCNEIGVSRPTIEKYILTLQAEGKVADDDIRITVTGHKLFSRNLVNKLKAHISEKQILIQEQWGSKK